MKTVLKNIALGLVKVSRGLLKAAVYISSHQDVIVSAAATVSTLTGHPEVGTAIRRVVAVAGSVKAQ